MQYAGRHFDVAVVNGKTVTQKLGATRVFSIDISIDIKCTFFLAFLYVYKIPHL